MNDYLVFRKYLDSARPASKLYIKGGAVNIIYGDIVNGDIINGDITNGDILAMGTS